MVEELTHLTTNMHVAPIHPTTQPENTELASSDGEEALPGVLLLKKQRRKGRKNRKHQTVQNKIASMTSVFAFGPPTPYSKSKQMPQDKLKGNKFSFYLFFYILLAFFLLIIYFNFILLTLHF